ncbi:MAG: HDOD domain-containing protein [Candidatus Abyssobacteria bacterium SURF_5]|uniref:HDOD domain-containing protein n=1 Tax=Abyssobacteria bacterium (strain SURF_5) TaxID=2093360 RepID=A0A3A4NYA4_ABYX5|nr:MAG: HDOD domain-containing protein [Candidatus Abyssubacteria bacterium SURF_5]
MMQEELPEQLIENIVTLPTIPVVLAQLNSAIANADSSAADIAKIISHDPSTATKVLRLANSAYYGLRNKVTTINHAVTMLGFNIIRNLVTTATVFDTPYDSDMCGLFDREKFWQHSLATGYCSQILAREALHLDRRSDDFFICGLLHDLGKIIFGQYLQAQFQEALEVSRDEAIPLFEAEKKVIGCTHTDVGGLLAKRWNLSQDIISALTYHHLPLKASEKVQNYTIVTHVSDYLVRKKQIGAGGGSDPGIDQAAWETLRLDKKAVPEILVEVHNLMNQEGLELRKPGTA